MTRMQRASKILGRSHAILGRLYLRPSIGQATDVVVYKRPVSRLLYTGTPEEALEFLRRHVLPDYGYEIHPTEKSDEYVLIGEIKNVMGYDEQWPIRIGPRGAECNCKRCRGVYTGRDANTYGPHGYQSCLYSLDGEEDKIFEEIDKLLDLGALTGKGEE